MKKKLNLVYQEQANSEVQEAFLYYEEELEGLGERFLDELDRVVHSIQLAPKGFQKFHNYRQVPLEIFPYVVIYEVIKSTLIIYAVFQTQQHPKKKIR